MSHGRFAPRAHFVPQMHMQVRYACICDVDDVCRTDMLGVKSDRDGEKVEDEVYQIYRFITKYRVDSSHNCEKICSKSPQNLPVMQTHRKR